MSTYPITAKELIRELNQMPDEAEVIMQVEPFGHNKSFSVNDIGWEYYDDEAFVILSDYKSDK